MLAYLIKILQASFLAVSLFSISGCGRSHKAEVKKAKIGNAEFAYYTRGSGEPLIMIMGFRGTMAIWDPALLESLEKKFTLILFDNRAAGFSSDDQQDALTIAQMADDTSQLIKALGYQKTNVLGWSMGSRIAMELSLRHPEQVQNLILCSPNPGGKNQAPRKTDAYAKLTAKTLSEQEALSLLFPETAQGLEAAAAYVARITEAVVRGSVPNDLVVSEQTVERQVQALMLWSENNGVYDSLSNIKAPTLVAGGLADVLDPPDNIRIVASRIPYAWTAYFAGAGHNFLSQYHKDSADLIILFIESNK